MATITLKIPDHLLERLDRAALSANTTRSAFVREALVETLESAESGSGSCFDLAGDLMGSVEGLPFDLATNPKYMEDFGK